MANKVVQYMPEHPSKELLLRQLHKGLEAAASAGKIFRRTNPKDYFGKQEKIRFFVIILALV